MKGSFFCEACGAEVRGRSNSCPSCGRSFLGVKCPRCAKEGSADEFKRGCPDCGYLAEIKTDETSSAHRPSHPDWPASRYWVLSALLVISLGTILFLWLR